MASSLAEVPRLLFQLGTKEADLLKRTFALSCRTSLFRAFTCFSCSCRSCGKFFLTVGYGGSKIPTGLPHLCSQSLNNELTAEVESPDYLTLFSLVTRQEDRRREKRCLSAEIPPSAPASSVCC